MKLTKSLVYILQFPRAFLHILLLEASAGKDVIKIDIERWLQETGVPQPTILPRWASFIKLLWRCAAFRNLFYYRIEREERLSSRILLELAKLLYKPIDSLYIHSKMIGPGLYIQHGFCTIISAKSIGQHCWVNQQVTIGYSNSEDTPVIGDNVRITAGAKVIGNIFIGNNSIIGANAVVVKDVPPDCTVVGVPAYIVKCAGKKVRRPL